MEEIIKLLLVEDDANLCYIIQGGLEDMIGGYKVLTASNGEEGLAVWKAQQPDVEALTQERDAAQKELLQLKNEKVLTAKGVKADDLDYVLFKVSKLVDDKTDFAKAAERFLKENPRYTGAGTYRVSTSTGEDNQSGGSRNSSINDAIRAAARR